MDSRAARSPSPQSIRSSLTRCEETRDILVTVCGLSLREGASRAYLKTTFVSINLRVNAGLALVTRGVLRTKACRRISTIPGRTNFSLPCEPVPLVFPKYRAATARGQHESHNKLRSGWRCWAQL